MWKPSPLSWPNAAQAIQSSADTVTSQVSTVMSEATGRLTPLQGDANYGRHPLSSEAQTLLGLRSDLEALLTTGTIISATPYQFQVGGKVTTGDYLNPQTAVQVLAAKMRDHADKHRPQGHLHCVAVMVTASQLATFANNLSELVSVFPLPDWTQTARQTSALVTNDTDKFHQPAAIVQPRIKPQANLNANPLRKYLGYQCSQIATLESLANDKATVIDKLSQLAEKRGRVLEEISVKIDTLKVLKGSVYACSLSGNPESIAAQIVQANTPNNHQFTVASLLLSHQPITFFEGLLC